MTETTIEYQYEHRCKVCGATQLSDTESEHTLSEGVKNHSPITIPADHECKFTDVRELEDPIVETFEY